MAQAHDLQIKGSAESFFFRLASAFPNPQQVEEHKLGYYSPDSHKPRELDRYVDHPERYLSIVINRVPRSVKFKEFVPDIKAASNPEDDLLTQLVTDSDKTVNWLPWMIAYDENIESQFLVKGITRTLKGKRLESLTSHLLDLANDLSTGGSISAWTKGSLADDHEAQTKAIRDFYASLINADRNLNEVRQCLVDNSMSGLSRLVLDEWLPSAPFRSFRSSVSAFMLDTGVIRSFDIDVVNDVDDIRRRTRVAKEIFTNLKSYIENSPNMKTRRSPDQEHLLLSSIAAVVGFVCNAELVGSPSVFRFLVELAATYIGAQLVSLSDLTKGRERISLQRFLVETEVNLQDAPFRNCLKPGFMELSFDMVTLNQLYRMCAKAQARMIDLIPDSVFLIHAIRAAVERIHPENAVFPYIKEGVSAVIESKTVSHDVALTHLVASFGKYNYHRDFLKVMSDALARWGI